MKVTCLVENTPGNELCQTEHGLSLYVETKTQVILIDTGASGLFLENAAKLGVDISKVETVFLSHGHYDHGGGILTFQEVNSDAMIVMQKAALNDFWHISTDVKKYIGLDWQIKEMKNLILTDGEYRWNENLEVFTLAYKEKEQLKCWPEGNLVLKERKDNAYIQDNFIHEQYIVIREDGKSILISGCAHNGIINILAEYHRRYKSNPDVIISGFHMRKKSGYHEDDIKVMKETAGLLKESGILCYTGHCTGEEPYAVMKEIMDTQLQYIHCGDVIEIE